MQCVAGSRMEQEDQKLEKRCPIKLKSAMNPLSPIVHSPPSAIARTCHVPWFPERRPVAGEQQAAA